MTIVIRASATALGAALLLGLTTGPAVGTPPPERHSLGRGAERVNLSGSGAQANAASSGAALSVTGRYVAFSSSATNLVDRDTNRVADVFVRDRKRAVTTRVSVTSSGAQANGESGFGLAISANGRFITYLSNARNLAGQPNSADERTNVFVYDRVRHTTEQANVSSSERRANYSASWPVGISGNGRYVIFVSAASNLVAERSTGEQVYVRDRRRDTTTLVSRDAAGRPFPGGVSQFDATISANGRFAAFTTVDSTYKSNLYVRDLRRHTTAWVAAGGQPSLSANGRFLAFQACEADVVPGDFNNQCDAFLRDRKRGTTRIVSLNNSDGQADNGTYGPGLSPEGRYVSFSSDATNLVPGDTNGARDVFVRDTHRHRTVRASVGYKGQGTGGGIDAGGSGGGSLSAGARYVGFGSDADNLVPGDTNGVPDAFVIQLR